MYPLLNRVCRPFVAMLALLAMSPLLVAVPQEFSTKLNVPSKDVHVGRHPLVAVRYQPGSMCHHHA